jgi:hypothetical protein
VRIDQTEQFVVHGVGFFFFGGAQGFGSAMLKMIFHQIAGHSAQRFLYRGDLHDDVGAVAIVAYHFLQAAYLAFNAAETLLIALFERGVDGNGFMAGPHEAGTLGGRYMGGWFGRHLHYTPYGYLYPYPLFGVNLGFCGRVRNGAGLDEAGIMPDMTLMEIKYALASPLTIEQLSRLGEFANTYGLRKFHLNDAKTELSFEYDASRLRETQVEHVLGQAKIAVAKKLN